MLRVHEFAQDAGDRGLRVEDLSAQLRRSGYSPKQGPTPEPEPPAPYLGGSCPTSPLVHARRQGSLDSDLVAKPQVRMLRR